MALFKKSKSDVAALKAELQDLRKYKEDSEKRGVAASKGKVFLAKLWAGPELSKSLEAWIRAKNSRDSDETVSATANLLAAILRRVMRVSFVFILIAAIPILLIIWQNIIMERQNQSLIRQIEAQRAATSNQQLTEYIRLLLSSEPKEVAAAEGFLVSDLVNRDIAVKRLATLMKAGSPDVQCRALNAMSRILESSPELTLQKALSPSGEERTTISDLRCAGTDFSGVDFGEITFVESGFPFSTFKSSDVSGVEFRNSNLRHSDFTESYLCKGANRCTRFLAETDLSHSSLTFTNHSKNVFRGDVVLKAAQLTFGQDDLGEADKKKPLLGTKQIKAATPAVPKFSRDNLILSTGTCYESSFSQCYLLHKAIDEGKITPQRFDAMRKGDCPVNLDGPIVLTSLTTCKKLGLEAQR